MAASIKEIAVDCGVSEQAVRAWCRRNHVAKDAKASFAIDETTKTLIYQHYGAIERKQVSQHAKPSCETCETSETTLIAMLQSELEHKNQQLEVKSNAALVAAQQTAQAAQALHAGTIQQQFLTGEAGGEPRDGVIREERKQGFWSKFFGK